MGNRRCASDAVPRLFDSRISLGPGLGGVPADGLYDMREN